MVDGMDRLDVDDVYKCKACGRWHPLYVKYQDDSQDNMGRRLYFDCARERDGSFYAGRIGGTKSAAFSDEAASSPTIGVRLRTAMARTDDLGLVLHCPKCSRILAHLTRLESGPRVV